MSASPKRVDISAIKAEVKKMPPIIEWWYPQEVPSVLSIVCPLDSAVKLRKLKFPGDTKGMKVNSGLEFSKEDLAGFVRTGIKLTTTYVVAVDVAGLGIRAWSLFPQQLVFLASDDTYLEKELSVVKQGFGFSIEPTKSPAKRDLRDDGERMLRCLEDVQKTVPTDDLTQKMAEFLG